MHWTSGLDQLWHAFQFMLPHNKFSLGDASSGAGFYTLSAFLCGSLRDFCLGSWGAQWIFIGRTVAEAKTPILWPPDAKSWLIGKDSDAGEDWGQEKRMTGDKMIGWHHWLNGQEFEQAPGDGEGQGSLVCYSPWGRKESDTTEGLNNGNNTYSKIN